MRGPRDFPKRSRSTVDRGGASSQDAAMRIRLLSLVGLGAVACASAPPRPPAAPVRSLGLAVRPLDLGRFELRAKVAIDNDTALPWKLQAAMAQVTVDGVISGSDTVTLAKTVPPHGTLEVEIPADAEPLRDARALRDWEAKGERQIPVVVGGAIQIDEGSGIHDRPFSAVGSLKPPRLPAVTVAEAAIAAQTATFVLAVRNPNAFPVAVRAISCHASVAGREVAEGVAQGPHEIPAGGVARYRWSGGLPASGAAADAQRMAQGRLDYRLEGELDLGRLQLPLRFDGPLQSGG